ncbi:uncharacterized protein TNCV_4410751 [Trichonephila clavipes]|nr:uncharacterized protein TNCV_4410751 [Trichonephila clavipes]
MSDTNDFNSLHTIDTVKGHASFLPLACGFVCVRFTLPSPHRHRVSKLEVSEELGIAQSVISRFWQRFQDDGNVSRCYSTGGPRVTMTNEDRYLAVTAKRNRRSTASDLSRQLSSATGTTVSRQTVYRRLGSDLHVQSVTMTGHIYRDVILEQQVRLFRGAMGAEFLFMDDNARPHRANIVDECLQSEDITRMDRPA